jgi:ankyrin repeat protein
MVPNFTPVARSNPDVATTLAYYTPGSITCPTISNNVGNAYWAQQEKYNRLTGSNERSLDYEWDKLVMLKDKFHMRVIELVYLQSKDLIPNTILLSPLPIPDALVSSTNNLRRLLDSGWTTDYWGRTLLHIILDIHHPKSWSETLPEGFSYALSKLMNDINKQDVFGRSALAIACEKGSHSATAALLNAGADLKLRTVGNLHALHIAAASGSRSVCDLLLSFNAIAIYARDSFGRLPLHYAAGHGHVNLVHLLLAAHNHFKRRVLSDHVKDNIGNTPLHTAILAGHREIVAALACQPFTAEMDLANNNGEMPFLVAARIGHLEILTEMGNMPQINCNHENCSGETVLSLAVKQNDIRVVQCLLALPRTQLFRTRDNRNDSVEAKAKAKAKTVLDFAIENKLFEIAELLRVEIVRRWGENWILAQDKIRILERKNKFSWAEVASDPLYKDFIFPAQWIETIKVQKSK